MLDETILRLALGLGAITEVLAPANAQQANVAVATPVVVELFTSQGCDTCLAVSDFIGEFAKRPDVIVLTFHVDYWDYIGWKDSLAIPAAVTRQRAYERSLGKHLLYTPQVVVDGVVDVPMGTRGEVDRAIDGMEGRTTKLALRFIRHQDGSLSIAIPEGSPTIPARIWLAFFDREVVTSITAGDNAGRTMRSINVVRRIVPLGEWQGAAQEIPLDAGGDGASSYDGCAVLVQTEPLGPILGAESILLDRMGAP